MITDQDVRRQVETLLDGDDDYNADAITAEIIDTYGLVDLNVIAPDQCWDIVARHQA